MGKDNKNKKMTRGVIADFLGITKNSIRNYEKLELVEPSFDDNNQYHFFDTKDISQILQIRMLRSLDFSLDEINDILTMTDLDLLDDTVTKHIEELADKRVLIESMIQKSSFLLDKIHASQNYSEEIHFSDLPLTLYFQNRLEHKPSSEDSWSKYMPLSTTSGILNFNNSFEFRDELGMILKEKDIPFDFDYHSVTEKIVLDKYLTQKKICYMVNGDYVKEDYIPLIEYAKQNHLSYENRIITYGLMAFKEKDRNTYFLELFLPLK